MLHTPLPWRGLGFAMIHIRQFDRCGWKCGCPPTVFRIVSAMANFGASLLTLTPISNGWMPLVFFGLKDQLELLLHILRNSTVLKTMRIEPKQTVVAGFCPLTSVDPLASADGYKVAKKCIFCKEDHRGVVQIAGVRFANAPLYHWSTTASCRNHAWKLNT